LKVKERKKRKTLFTLFACIESKVEERKKRKILFTLFAIPVFSAIVAAPTREGFEPR